MILEVCRACCKNKSTLFNLFESESEHNITLAEMFSITTGLLVVKDDQWPQSICTYCLMAMIDTYELMIEEERNLQNEGLV